MNQKRLVYIGALANDEKIGTFIQTDLENMKQIFESYEDEGQIILRTDEILTTDLLIRRLALTKIYPWLFYFSGHSKVDAIQLSDREISSDDFANLFDNVALNNHLQLVYLGSCDSDDIGQKLIEKGVKVVIASTQEVPAHLANIVSRFFFNQFLLMPTIQEAFERTETLFRLTRGRLDIDTGVVLPPDFPWLLLTSSETNLEKTLPKISLSPEQKYLTLVRSVEAELELTGYFQTYGLEHDLLADKTTFDADVISIKDHLEASLSLVENNDKVKNLFDIWKSNASPNAHHRLGRFLRKNIHIEDLPQSNQFKKITKKNIGNLINLSERILFDAGK